MRLLQSVGDTNLEWIGFTTTACPKMESTFLAGKCSVYRAVPNSVLAAATELDKHKIEHWLENQPETCITKREKVGEGAFEKVEEVLEEF
jgi:hypothetical protein